MPKLIIYCLKLFSRVILVVGIFSLLSPNPTFASQWQKYPTNPIFVPSISGGWDSAHVQNPHIIKVNNIYNMWYDGLSQYVQGWKTGYAYSSDGLSNWTRNTQPVFLPGSPDGWETETGDPFVFYNQSNFEYKMWYTSYNTSNWISGPDRYRTRLATLINNTWIKSDGWIDSLKGMNDSWDSGGTARGRSIIYKDNIYRLWYTATNNNNLSINPYWRIGYATSNDGINWIKETTDSPITITNELSNTNVSYPTVLYHGGLYHMWYAAGADGNPSEINYAYSSDGISWVKPLDQNPALNRTQGTFDQASITPSTVVEENGLLKMWYSGFNGSHWSIGYATAPTSILVSLPAPPTKKVVIVPGLGGSWNPEAIIGCTLDPSVGSWTSIDSLYPGTDPYISLRDKLINSDYTPFIYYYDWRKQPADNAASLGSFISNIDKLPLEKVHLMGHSLGGLVSRAYLESQQNNLLDRLLFVGAPFGGSALAYPAWSGGDIWWDNDIQRTAMTIVLKWCGLKNGKTDRQVVRDLIPSVQNLLPKSPFLLSVDNVLKDMGDMTVRNNLSFLPNLTTPYNNTILGTLSGNGKDTLGTIIYKKPTPHDIKTGNWIDGKPFKTINSTYGDGTVLTSSSQIPSLGEGANISITSDHTGLVNSDTGMRNIFTFLGIPYPQTLSVTPSPFTSALVIIGSPAEIMLTTPDGVQRRDVKGFLGIVNPKPGQYRVQLNSKDPSARYAVAQFLPNKKTLWKDYSANNVVGKQNIIFDPDNPVEDALQ